VWLDADGSIGFWGNGIRIYSGPLRVTNPVKQVAGEAIEPDDEEGKDTDSVDLLYPLPTGREERRGRE
jgi:hypothetical protein